MRMKTKRWILLQTFNLSPAILEFYRKVAVASKRRCDRRFRHWLFDSCVIFVATAEHAYSFPVIVKLDFFVDLMVGASPSRQSSLSMTVCRRAKSKCAKTAFLFTLLLA